MKKGGVIKGNTPRILIVEDEEFMIRILTRELLNNGLKDFVVVTQGQDVVREFISYNPNVIVLDILLPHKNGLEALKEVRRLKKGKEVVVFVLTNYDTHEFREEALELGVQEYLLKTSTPISDLIQRIKELFPM